MTMKLVMLASVLSLVACGGGEPRSGGWDGNEPPPDEGTGAGRPTPLDTGGSGSVAGGGGAGQVPTGGGTGPVATGGTIWGGSEAVGGESSAAGDDSGGYGGISPGGSGGHAGTIATGGGGVSQGGVAGAGGAEEGGSGGVSGGGGGSDLSCLANVAHCFDAAANCFAYSPGSDCDQIVDVCAEMQADCESVTP